MSGKHKVAATASTGPENCNCPKLDCPRHGDCSRCRAHHAYARHPRPPHCERRPGILRRLLASFVRVQ